MKKISYILLTISILSSICMFAGCEKKSQNGYSGTLSTELYASVEEAEKGFIKNELESSTRIEFLGYEKERELSKEEIASLPLGKYADVQSAEKGKICYHTTYYSGGLLLDSIFQSRYPNELKSGICLLKYADGVRYFSLPPENGERFTKSYFAYVFGEATDNPNYENCTIEYKDEFEYTGKDIIEAGEMKEVRKFPSLIKVTQDALYLQEIEEQKITHFVQKKETYTTEQKKETRTYVWKNGEDCNEYVYEKFYEKFYGAGGGQEEEQEQSDCHPSRLTYWAHKYVAISGILTMSFFRLGLTVWGEGFFFKTKNGFSFDIILSLELKHGVKEEIEGKFEGKMKGDRIEKMTLQYKGGTESFHSVTTVKKIGTTKVEIPQNVLESSMQ